MTTSEPEIDTILKGTPVTTSRVNKKTSDYKREPPEELSTENISISPSGAVEMMLKSKNVDIEKIIFSTDGQVLFEGVTMKPEPHKWEKVSLFISGIVFLLLILLLLLFIPTPTPTQMWGFRVIMALAGGAFASFIPGFFHLNIRKELKAGGGLAVFAFLYYTNPPELLVSG